MRIVLWLLLAVLSYANTFDFVKAYRDGGIKALERKIDEALQTKEYWTMVLAEVDHRYGYYENLKYLFIATKNEPTLKLYENTNSQWSEKLNINSLVGAKLGNKQKEGDLATPIGVYEFNGRLTKLDQYYGPLAFSTNYPNLYDKILKKTGYGIWIHGKPLNGDRTDLNTRGCIVIENNEINFVDQLINYNDALLITFEEHSKEASTQDLATLLASLYQWREAWKSNDVQSYLAFYDEDEFTRFDGMKYPTFAQNKKAIFQRNEKKSIQFSQINISPYPNETNRNLFRMSFFEDYKAPNYVFKGKKELYVELKDQKMRILVER